MFAYGSSPLTRGKPDLTMEDATALGLIPAHAGKTGCGEFVHSNAGAHPRSRGENGRARSICGVREGSSPLTRGKLAGAIQGALTPRLIPAHAGKTWPSQAKTCRPPAHPRSRGENKELSALNYADLGSSPLTRGKRSTRHHHVRRSGLIPAHAGKTTPSGSHPPLS